MYVIMKSIISILITIWKSNMNVSYTLGYTDYPVIENSIPALCSLKSQMFANNLIGIFNVIFVRSKNKFCKFLNLKKSNFKTLIFYP